MNKLLAVMLLVGAVSANAMPIVDFTMLGAQWYNNVGGNIVSNTVGFADPASVRWGGANQTPSGYDFDSRTTPFSEAANDVFALGSFTHFNQPIKISEMT